MQKGTKRYKGKPYERMEGESQKAFEAFCRYRDMGRERTARKVAQEFGKSDAYMNQLSQVWHWIERSKAWIDELDKRRREATLKEIQEMAKRHTQQAMIHQKILMLPGEAIIKRINKDGTGKIRDFEGLTIGQLYDKAANAAFIHGKVVDIERKSRGEPTEINKSDLTSGGNPIRVILPPISAQELENV